MYASLRRIRGVSLARSPEYPSIWAIIDECRVGALVFRRNQIGRKSRVIITTSYNARLLAIYRVDSQIDVSVT